MSLFNKYEPKNLNEIIGNENNKIILNGFLKQEKIPQIYLFTGAYGCGKTLFSNLLAKELKCGFNIYELNASSDRGIEAIRNIIDNCHFRSLDGNPKAYILDECHQLPSLSQDALLTTFQKPPENVYFYLCTTEKNKLLPTLISRCKQIEVEKVSDEKLISYLIHVSLKENNKIDNEVAEKIVRSSEGHIRDALNILEIVLQFTDKEKQLEMANKELKQKREAIELCRALSKDWQSVQSVLKKLDESEDIERLRRIILSYYSKVLLNTGNSKAGIIIQAFSNNFFDSGRPGFIAKCYEIFL